MIEIFQFYIDNNLVKKKSLDIEEGKALLNKALQRLEFIKKQEITEQNSPFLFEELYETVREAAQSLMSLEGYKPYSHEAIISFLKEFHTSSESDLNTFDRYRILRNESVYGAKKVSAITCAEALEFVRRFVPELNEVFNEKVGEKNENI